MRTEGFSAVTQPPARPPPPGKRQLSQDMLSRTACIEATVSKAVKRQSVESIAFDWAAEAQRIRTSTPPEYGRPEAEEPAEAAGGSTGGGAAAQAAQAASADSLYVLTGSSHWQTATAGERREVVLAFGSNRSLREVRGMCMALAHGIGAWRSMCMACMCMARVQLRGARLCPQPDVYPGCTTLPASRHTTVLPTYLPTYLPRRGLRTRVSTMPSPRPGARRYRPTALWSGSTSRVTPWARAGCARLPLRCASTAAYASSRSATSGCATPP